MARRAARAGLCIGFLFAPALNFVPCVRPHIRGKLLARSAEAGSVPDIVVNEDIKADEVRIIGMWNDESKEIEDANDVMPTKTALQLAKQMGLDVLCVNTERDPPLVKLVNEGKYRFIEKKEARQRERNAQAPKIKEVKVTYNIGEGDIITKIKAMKQWLVKDKRQQVKVRVIMKGRTRMFETQARELLMRFREDLANEAKVPGSDRGVVAVTKDGRGDLNMLLGKGPDLTILKQLKEEGRLPGLDKPEPVPEVTAAAAKDDASTENVPKEVQEILDEIGEMREELLDCGISPGQVDQEEEMKELQQRLMAVRSKTTAGALGAGSARAPRGPPALALAGGCAALTALLRPRRR